MIQLPHGCYCSDFSVFPKNWDSPRASEYLVKKDWRIQYRFYDPSVKEGPFAKGRLIIIKRMNSYRTLAERQGAVRILLDHELELLKAKGYNQITKQYVAPLEVHADIDPETPFIMALRAVLEKISVEHHTKIDIKSKIKYVEQAAIHLHMNNLPIRVIRRKHIKLILDRLSVIRKATWSDNTYNKYLAYLRILFAELLEYEAAETNPISDMKRKKVEPRAKKILTPEECKKVDDFVKQYDPNFRRLIHIFFHSGSRTTEMFRLQVKDVDLEKQVATYLVKKGQKFRRVERPIKNVVMDMWKEQLNGANPEDYVFSVGLLPGRKQIRSDQARKRWSRHIQGKLPKGKKAKNKLQIDCSWYALKHLNTDQTAELLDLEAAQRQNAQSTPVITMIYAVGEKARKMQQLKEVNNPFAK